VIEDLRDRWKAIWKNLYAHMVSQDVFEELRKAYSASDRFYHNLTHIGDCLSIFDETKALAAHAEEVELAIWFHDVIYDTRRNDNEQKSAEWAKSVIHQAGVGPAVAERVFHSILATRHDRQVINTDAQLMADVDLSILGSETKAFWQYEENIRREYAWVPESIFREKRIEILRDFLSRESIYYNDLYREMFEEKAHENLKQAIAKLSDSADLL
jgi:predicted metal-dependent HD superfamily phosphohydrolase